MQSVGPLVVKFAGAGGGGKLVGVLDAGFVHDGGENFGAAHFVFVDGTAGQAEIAELFVGVDRAAAVDALFQVVDACNLVQTVFGNDIQGFFVLKGLFVESGNFFVQFFYVGAADVLGVGFADFDQRESCQNAGFEGDLLVRFLFSWFCSHFVLRWLIVLRIQYCHFYVNKMSKIYLLKPS